MTKAILVVWLVAQCSTAAPSEIEFDDLSACQMSAAELKRNPAGNYLILARCVDLGKAP